MKYLFRFFLLSAIWFSVGACQNRVPEKVSEAPLIHLVALELRDNLNRADRDTVLKALEELKKLKQPLALRIGERATTGDPRLLPGYDLILEVHFAHAADLALYAEDPLHLAVRSKIKPYLASPPVVVDYQRLPPRSTR